MIDEFCEYFEGTFENKIQAMSNPTKFAMIELVHTPYGKYKFRCIQRYYFDKKNTEILLSLFTNKILNFLLKTLRRKIQKLES